MDNYQRREFGSRKFFTLISLLIVSEILQKSIAVPHNLSKWHRSINRCDKRLINRTNVNSQVCTPDKIEQLLSGSDIPWRNPCSGSPYISDEGPARRRVSLEPLKLQLKRMLGTDYGSCHRSDRSSTDWCHKKPQYTFFESSRKTDKLCLSLEHKRLQVFVAGLSYLTRYDGDLKRVLENAKTLLCEIETVISQTKCRPFPKALAPKEMCLRLRLESIVNEDATELDIIFAKANFGKYLRGLHETLSSLQYATICKSPQHGPYELYSSIVSRIALSRSDQSRSNGQRIHRRMSKSKYRNTDRQWESRTKRAVYP